MPAESSRAVFLSYASQDADAARKIADALRGAAIEVWLDQSELVGGNAWDREIRKQIKECALFVPVISANTQARAEGYFRLEWRLAVERSRLMADDQPFFMPVVIDATPDAMARVPEEFRVVQWTRLRPAGFGGQARPDVAGPSGQARPDGADAFGQTLHEASLAAFCARVGRLLADQAGGGTQERRAGGLSGEALTRSASTARPPPATAPLSEVQPLLAQMWQIYEKSNDGSREDWALADELGARAVRLEPHNANAWAAYSVVTITAWFAGFDNTDAHFNAGMKWAERAMTLAPDSVEPRLAYANCLRLKPATRAEGERMLRELAQQAPTDKRVLRTFAGALRLQRKFEEALAVLEQALALPGDNVATLFGKGAVLTQMRRDVESEAVNEQILAQRPSPFAYVMRTYYQAYFHDDLEQARATLEKIPPAYLLKDEGAYIANRVWLWRGDYDRSVAALSGVTEDYLQNRFTGDSALAAGFRPFLTGQAHQLAGRKAAAEFDWRAGLHTIKSRLATEPGRPEALFWKARLLANLGERGEAGRVLEAFRQLAAIDAEGKFSVTLVLIPLGRLDEAVTLLRECLPDTKVSTMARCFWRVMLVRDPTFEPLRRHPEFPRLVSLLPAPAIGVATTAPPAP